MNCNFNSSPANKSNNVWSLGAYNEFAIFILPVSAHLVRLCNISSGENILDMACGTGNTAITARRMVSNIKVTGIDFTPELLAQAKEQASLAEVDDIEWKEGNVECPAFEDEVFDAVLSSFGHMFAAHPEAVVKEMLRVTKPGGQIAFSTWPFELVNGRLFKAMAKHLPAANTNSIYSDNQSDQKQQQIMSSPMQWGNPDFIQRILQENSKGTIEDIHFERGFVKIPVLSPNHYWKTMSTKSGPVIQAIQAIKEPSKIEALKKDVIKAIAPYHKDNELKLDYIITRAMKNKQQRLNFADNSFYYERFYWIAPSKTPRYVYQVYSKILPYKGKFIRIQVIDVSYFIKHNATDILPAVTSYYTSSRNVPITIGNTTYMGMKLYVNIPNDEVNYGPGMYMYLHP